MPPGQVVNDFFEEEDEEQYQLRESRFGAGKMTECHRECRQMSLIGGYFCFLAPIGETVRHSLQS